MSGSACIINTRRGRAAAASLVAAFGLVCCSAPKQDAGALAVPPAPASTLDRRTDLTIWGWSTFVPVGQKEATISLILDDVVVWKGQVSGSKDRPLPEVARLRLAKPLKSSGEIEVRMDVTDDGPIRARTRIEPDKFLVLICLSSGLKVVWLDDPNSL